MNKTFDVNSHEFSLNEAWGSVLFEITKELGETVAKIWFSQVSPQKIENNLVIMETKQRLTRDRLSGQYNKELLECWRKHCPSITAVDVVLSEDREIFIATNEVDEQPIPPNDVPEKRSKIEDEIFIESSSHLDSRFTFNNFIVGKPNEFAHAAALSVSESEKIQFNPLFLYGGVGLGKTHLMHAIAWKIKESHPEKKIIYLSAEKFMYQFIRALRFKDTMSFKEQFRSVDVLMIDDFQFIGGKETTQEEFFHTFNALVDGNKQVIISADKSPADLENIGERMKSRLGWGLVADIHPTTYELRLGILQSKIEALNINLPKDVIEFLAAKITSNVRELEGALNRIMAHSSLVGRTITIDSTRDVLRDLIRSNEKYITIEDIQKRTCEFFGIKISDLLSSKRLKALAKARHVAMYLCKTLTTKSFPEIGRKFGGRDHSTVIFSVKKIQELCLKDADLLEDIETLKASIEGI